MPTKEEINQKIDILPETLREILYSPELLEKVEAITTAHHLNEEKMRLVAGVLLRLITGYIYPEDLAKELTSRLQVDKRVAEDVAKEIRIKILYPIAEDLRTTHGFHIEGAPAPAQPTVSQVVQQVAPSPSAPPDEELAAAPPTAVLSLAPTLEPEETILKPHLQKEEFPAEPLVSPFILHEHEDVEATQETIHYTENLARPSFHAPEDYGTRAGEYAEPAPAARLELGTQTKPEIYIKPKTTRIGKEEAKIVHYTAPDVQADPFSKTPEPATKPAPPKPAPQAPKPSVHPDNIVNLKDLPK